MTYNGLTLAFVGFHFVLAELFFHVLCCKVQVEKGKQSFVPFLLILCLFYCI